MAVPAVVEADKAVLDTLTYRLMADNPRDVELDIIGRAGGDMAHPAAAAAIYTQ
jgi:hypothetical protein